MTHDPVRVSWQQNACRETSTWWTQAGVRRLRSGAKPPLDRCTEVPGQEDISVRLTGVGGLPAYGHVLPDQSELRSWTIVVENRMSACNDGNGGWTMQSTHHGAPHALEAISHWTSTNVSDCTIPLKESICVKTVTSILACLSIFYIRCAILWLGRVSLMRNGLIHALACPGAPCGSRTASLAGVTADLV